LVQEVEKVQGLIENVTTNEALIRHETLPKEALAEAEKIKKKFDESIKKVKQYKEYQDTLKVEQEDIKEIAEFEQKFNFRHRIWSVRAEFGGLKTKWYGENFREQDAVTMVQITKERESELNKMKVKMGSGAKDEVLETAQAEIKDVSRHNNLITALGQKAMQDKHWAKVWALVDPTPTQRITFTFKQLLQSGIDQHFEDVE
jgi:hypothetical protein